eukprot:Skav209677  [mRNA]  locus=scaffold1603:50956:51717:- [translate_table: standard]
MTLVEQAGHAFLLKLEGLIRGREVTNGTLDMLRRLDTSLTYQWLGVNTSKTVSAGLSIASFVLILSAPPVAIGLGVGAAVAGLPASGADSYLERERRKEFRQAMEQDKRRFQEMIQALGAYGRALRRASANTGDDFRNALDVYEALLEAINHLSPSPYFPSQFRGFASANNTERLIRPPPAVSHEASGPAAVSSFASGVGMALYVGEALHSWSTSKDIQTQVRQALQQIEQSVAILRRVRQQMTAALGPSAVV